MIFQTINSVCSSNQSLKYQSLTQSGCKDIVISKFSLWQSLNSGGRQFKFIKFGPCQSKPLIFQTWIFGCNTIHSLKYLSCTTLGCKDMGITNFMAKAQFLSSTF